MISATSPLGARSSNSPQSAAKGYGKPTQNLSFWTASDYLCRGGGVCLRWLVTCREGAWQLLVDTCSEASISHISYHYLAYSFNEVIWKKMASSQMKSSTLHSISSISLNPRMAYSAFSAGLLHSLDVHWLAHSFIHYEFVHSSEK